jgi:hypothetical protein
VLYHQLPKIPAYNAKGGYGVRTAILIIAAIIGALILGLVMSQNPDKDPSESSSPKFRHKVRDIQFINPIEKATEPVRRDK